MQSGDVVNSWQVAHETLVELAHQQAGLEFEEGHWLLAARRAKAHRQLGYGSFTEYIERLFGYAPRLTHDKLRVAEALESLPALAHELREGALNFSQVRELTRIATAETEKAWLESARGCTSRQVEKLVSGRRSGSLPDSPAEPELQRHILRFEVSGETLATFREAVAKLRHDVGEHLDDDATLLVLARNVLGGPTDEGRASYQVAIDVCEECRRARQTGDGDLFELSPVPSRWLHATRNSFRVPTWASYRTISPSERHKTCRRLCVGACCGETIIAAKSLVVLRELSLTFITFTRAPMAAVMIRSTWSPSAPRITEPCTRAR